MVNNKEYINQGYNIKIQETVIKRLYTYITRSLLNFLNGHVHLPFLELSIINIFPDKS